MMVLLKAVGAVDHQTSKNDLSVCTHYGLRPKAMVEIHKIRRQLIQIGKLIELFFARGKLFFSLSPALIFIRRTNTSLMMYLGIPLVEKKLCLLCFSSPIKAWPGGLGREWRADSNGRFDQGHHGP